MPWIESKTERFCLKLDKSRDCGLKYKEANEEAEIQVYDSLGLIVLLFFQSTISEGEG